MIEAQQTSMGIEVSMPVFYPDGTMATVVMAMEDTKVRIHDASAGSIYLSAHGIMVTGAARERISEQVSRYGCEFVAGRVTRFSDLDQAPLAALTVANASRAVADHTAEVRRAVEADFRQAVVDGLRAIGGRRVRENEAVKGSSGRSYRLPVVLLDHSESRPLAFVAAVPNRASVPIHLTEMFDLKGSFADVAREAVYNEGSDLREEDRSLLAQVAELVPFTAARVRFAKLLQ